MNVKDEGPSKVDTYSKIRSNSMLVPLRETRMPGANSRHTVAGKTKRLGLDNPIFGLK